MPDLTQQLRDFINESLDFMEGARRRGGGGTRE